MSHRRKVKSNIATFKNYRILTVNELSAERWSRAESLISETGMCEKKSAMPIRLRRLQMTGS